MEEGDAGGCQAVVVGPSTTVSSSSLKTASTKHTSLYKERLKRWSKIHDGTLQNGFRFVIIPNHTPPNRMDAYLQVHTGSIDEEENEQGIAHFVEHAVFLGIIILFALSTQNIYSLRHCAK